MQNTISKEDISRMDTISFPGNIIIIDSHEKADEAIDYLNNELIIGFDTETKPAFKKGQVNKIALMQLSTDNVCFLFRINKIGIPDSLFKLLTNKNILKIGLSLKDDFMTIRRIRNFQPSGFLELQDYVKLFEIKEMSLQKIFALLFQKKISKSQRLSNWEAIELTPGQQKYAATDAWACFKIYDYLNNLKEL